MIRDLGCEAPTGIQVFDLQSVLSRGYFNGTAISITVFYQQYTLDSLQIRANDALIDMPYRPTISVFGDAGFNSSFLNQGWKNFGFNVGISASVIDKGSGTERYAIRQIERAREEAIDPMLREFNDKHALIGSIGSGKSTLLKCLGAVIEPTSGRMVLGQEVIYDQGWKIPDLRALRRDDALPIDRLQPEQDVRVAQLQGIDCQ